MDYLVHLAFKFITHPKRDSQPGCKGFRDLLFLCNLRRRRDHDIRNRLLHGRRIFLRSRLVGTEQGPAHFFFS
ncbi:hypothetical protein D3C85_1675040 [compost metagenome]